MIYVSRFTTPHHKEGFELFLDTITAMDDVWLVTSWQVVIIIIIIIIVIITIIFVIMIIIIMVIIIRRSSGCESRLPSQSWSLLSRSIATTLIDLQDVQVQRSVWSWSWWMWFWPLQYSAVLKSKGDLDKDSQTWRNGIDAVWFRVNIGAVGLEKPDGWWLSQYPATVKSHDAKSTMAKSVMAIRVSSHDGGRLSHHGPMTPGAAAFQRFTHQKTITTADSESDLRHPDWLFHVGRSHFWSSKTFTRYIPMLQISTCALLGCVKLPRLHKHPIRAQWIAQNAQIADQKHCAAESWSELHIEQQIAQFCEQRRCRDVAESKLHKN